MKYNPDIHNRKSIRLKGYDYSQPGAYFITLCCEKREHFFGRIVNGNLLLNEFGKIVTAEWLKTPIIRPNISLGDFVVMPNHFHAVVFINRRGESRRGELQFAPTVDDNATEPLQFAPTVDDNATESNHVGELQFVHAENIGTPFKSPSQTIGAIIRGFKGSVTNQINTIRQCKGCKIWERNYFERIIRDEEESCRISQYIIENPSNWNEDEFNGIFSNRE